MKRLTVGMSTLAVTVLAVQATALSQENSDSPEYTVYEVRVPWGSLGMSPPGAGQLLAINFIANENDGNGKSTCYDSCAAAWPPLQAEVRGDDVGDWSVIERDNGELQWAYKGKPVYMRFHDSVTEPRGDGLDGFHLLKP